MTHTYCSVCRTIKTDRSFRKPFICKACAPVERTTKECPRCGERKQMQSFRRLLTTAQAEAQGYFDHANNPRHAPSRLCRECQPAYHSTKALPSLPKSTLTKELERGRIPERMVEMELERRRMQGWEQDVSHGPAAARALAEYRVINRWNWWRWGDRIFLHVDERAADLVRRKREQRSQYEEGDPQRDAKLRTRKYLPLERGAQGPTVNGHLLDVPRPAHPWYNPRSLERQATLAYTDVWRFKNDRSEHGRAALEWALLLRTTLRALCAFADNGLEGRRECGPSTVETLTIRNILREIVQQPTLEGEQPLVELLTDDPLAFLNQRWRQRVDAHNKAFEGKRGRPITGMPHFLARPDVWIFEDMPGARRGVVSREDMEKYHAQLAAYEAAVAHIRGERT